MAQIDEIYDDSIVTREEDLEPYEEASGEVEEGQYEAVYLLISFGKTYNGIVRGTCSELQRCHRLYYLNKIDILYKAYSRAGWAKNDHFPLVDSRIVDRSLALNVCRTL